MQCIVARTIPNWAFLLQGICFSCLGSFVMQWAISKAPFKRAMPQLPHWSLCEVQLHDAYNRSVFCTSMPHWLGDHCDVQYKLVYCINPTYQCTSLLGWPLLLVLTLSSFTQYQTRLSRVDNLTSKPTICVCVLVAKPECEKMYL